MLILPCSAFGATLAGRVTAVPSGDVLTVATQQGTLRVRIAGIDAPESDQPFGPAAREFLQRRALHKEVRLESSGADSDGATLARVKLAGRDLAAELVSGGYAWALGGKKHSRRLRRLQAQARTARRGLWGEGTAFPPWEWRAARERLREQSKARRLPVTADRKQHVFYPPGCTVPPNLASGDRARFRTVREAETAGYLRSPECKTP